MAVTDDEVLASMRMVYERMKLVIEPSAAVGLAALLHPDFREQLGGARCDSVGVVLCGGNVDLDDFFQLLSQQIPQE